MTASVAVIAAKLEEYYGPDPSDVGKVDGTEDDFGDLMDDAWVALGNDEDDVDSERRGRFEAVASDSRCTTMSAWLAELEAV